MAQLRKIVAYLVVQNLPNIKDPIPIFQGENSFGRNPLKAQVCLPDASVSEKHAKIIANEYGITLIDIGSKNGTCLDNMEKKLQKNQSCSIKAMQKIFFAQIKCHFVMSKQRQLEQTLSQTENQEPEGINVKQEKREQRPKKQKTLDPKRKKQQKRVSPYKNQQEQTIQDSTKNSEKLKAKNNKSKKNNKQSQQNQNKFDQKTQNQIKDKFKQDATKDLKRQNKNKKKSSKEKANIKNQIKQNQVKVADQKKNAKPRNSKEKQSVKEKEAQKKVKFSKINKEHGESQDGTKIKSKIQEPKQSRKKVPSQQAVELRVSVTRKRFAVCSRFMISGFLLTFSTHQQLKLVEDINEQFDVLVMDKYSRTFKLLYAISKGIPIVSKDWLLQSQYYKKPMSPEHYILSIPEEKFLIKKSIEKVKQGFRLLSNCKFYFVCDHEKYHLKVSQIQKLIYAMDGQVVQAINPDKDVKAKNTIKNAFLILSRLKKGKIAEQGQNLHNLIDFVRMPKTGARFIRSQNLMNKQIVTASQL